MPNSCASSNEYPSVLPSIQSGHNDPICRCESCSSFPSSTTEFSCFPQEEVQKLDFEKFKAILQERSSRTGENLYEHLVEVIKRIIDERPVNVIDYFEQYSRNIRQNKLYDIDRCLETPQFLDLAKSVVEFVKPLNKFQDIEFVEEFENLGESDMTIYQSCDSSITKISRSLTEYENVFQVQQFWAFCGLGLCIDEVYQLSLSVQKVQFHQDVENARFWGRIFGLKGSYYVVEATLTRSAIDSRFNAMKIRLLEEMKSFILRKQRMKPLLDLSEVELIPGSRWKNCSEEELKKMKPLAGPIPQLQFNEKFREPEEAVGSGLNRRTYFVTTSLSQEWQELPSVVPEHIRVSRQIKKYFTGDLESNLKSYPLFPGTEKHYLRAMISRITSGTYIAPKGFYRRMTRKERNLAEKYYGDEEEFESEEEDSLDNDALLTKNADYSQLSLEELTLPSNWVHVRPNILCQGRVAHINGNLAIQDLEKKALLSMNGNIAIIEEGDEEMVFEDDELQQEDNNISHEIGPQLFSSCNEDKNNEEIPLWTSRYSSLHNKINQTVIMRSNLWPGAYSMAFENFTDCIYLGWGVKYVARCFSLQDLPDIQEVEYLDVAQEMTDPTVEMEEKWRRYNLKKEMSFGEELTDISVEFDSNDEDNI